MLEMLQDVPTPQTGAELIWYLVTLGVGAVVGTVAKALEKGSEVLNKLAEPVKMGLVAVLAFAVVKVETFLGLQLPDNPLTWDPEVVNIVLTALAALGIRAVGIKKDTTE